MEHPTAIANYTISARFWVLAAAVGLLLVGAAFWGAHKPALGLCHYDCDYLVVAIMICTNPMIFTFTDYVISDLLLVLFALVTLTICGFGANSAPSTLRVSLLAIVTGLACLTRLAAAPLIVAGSVYVFTNRG